MHWEIGSIVSECKARLNNFINFVSSIKWANTINLSVSSLEIDMVDTLSDLRHYLRSLALKGLNIITITIPMTINDEQTLGRPGTLHSEGLPNS